MSAIAPERIEPLAAREVDRERVGREVAPREVRRRSIAPSSSATSRMCRPATRKTRGGSSERTTARAAAGSGSRVARDGLGVPDGTATSSSSAGRPSRASRGAPPTSQAAIAALAGRLESGSPRAIVGEKRPRRPTSFGETRREGAEPSVSCGKALTIVRMASDRRAVTLGSRAERRRACPPVACPRRSFRAGPSSSRRIVSYIDQIERFPRSRRERLRDALPPTPVRDDEPRPGYGREALESNAPRQFQGSGSSPGSSAPEAANERSSRATWRPTSRRGAARPSRSPRESLDRDRAGDRPI